VALLLVRHGRTDANAAGLLLGRADPPLDDLGRAQAARIAEAMAEVEIVRVVTSPLQRARDTAAALGRPVTVDERWIELDYGEFDGVVARDVAADVWTEWRADPTFRPPGGESLADLGGRVRAACEELREEALAADVVVVSHVSPIKAAVGWAIASGDDLAWRLHLDVASITRIRIGANGPVLHRFNDVSHLT